MGDGDVRGIMRNVKNVKKTFYWGLIHSPLLHHPLLSGDQALLTILFTASSHSDHSMINIDNESMIDSVRLFKLD